MSNEINEYLNKIPEAELNAVVEELQKKAEFKIFLKKISDKHKLSNLKYSALTGYKPVDQTDSIFVQIYFDDNATVTYVRKEKFELIQSVVNQGGETFSYALHENDIHLISIATFKEKNVEIRWSKVSADKFPSGYIDKQHVQSLPLKNGYYIENIDLENPATDSTTQIMSACSTCKSICNHLQGMSCSLLGAAACTIVCAAIAGPACVVICGALWYVKCVLDNTLICGPTCESLGYC
ncbi:hypothetical protein FC756_12240 [Lysinibacillus mangiferihumi]|uniref:Uncharacterized protein n=1 Tax=Lysinibacillus mangiferihumi TaxID=1130819 RepID=A0A4U2Z3A1_9BACI|nr:hypothetical protein [Lysinibacillus mangiferihumi]TKI67812.1 hypothetical protein FC756_12240 [Lysinibacillus mangiferihumi]